MRASRDLAQPFRGRTTDVLHAAAATHGTERTGGPEQLDRAESRWTVGPDDDGRPRRLWPRGSSRRASGLMRSGHGRPDRRLADEPGPVPIGPAPDRTGDRAVTCPTGVDRYVSGGPSG